MRKRAPETRRATSIAAVFFSARLMRTVPWVGAEVSRLLRLEEGEAKRFGHPEDLARRAHLGSEEGSTSGILSKGKTASLTRSVGSEAARPSSRHAFAEHQLGRDASHRQVADLGDERHGA